MFQIIVRQMLSLINSLVGFFERLIARIVTVSESLRVQQRWHRFTGVVLTALQYADRLLLIAKRYLERVGRTLRFRLHYEAVTEPMRRRYRELKRHRG